MRLPEDISSFVLASCILAPLFFIHAFSRDGDNDDMINSITYPATHQPTHCAPNGFYANENDENYELHSLYCYTCTFYLLFVEVISCR